MNNWQLEFSAVHNFNNAVVIPAIQEYENILKLLASLNSNDDKCLKDTLIVFVINNTEESSIEIKEDNYKTLRFLRALRRKNYKNAESFKKLSNSIGIVDASSEGKELPSKTGGVGLARKIGMDLALQHFDYSHKQKKLLFCLDADCVVQSNYLNSIIKEMNSGLYQAATVNYNHLISTEKTEIDSAIICYEIFLRYYVLGLKIAKSPYAFHTVGSTIICTDQAYIKSEGMNKRKAAEDFYFIEKLAKNFLIKEIKSTTVFPSSRPSWRVPFGTGQRVRRFLNDSLNEYLLYNPQSFYLLKEWNEIFYTEDYNADELITKAKQLNLNLYNFLCSLNFKDDIHKIIKSSKNSLHLFNQKKRWFDGFRTLKLIHYLRDTTFQQVNMFDALDSLFAVENIKINRTDDIIPDFDNRIKYLETLRQLT